MKTRLHLLLAAVTVVVLFACNGLRPLSIIATDEPPGVGEKAEQGYAASAPVIDALEEFRADYGHYPELVVYLVPDYLPVLWTAPDELDYSYSTTGDSYTFSFHYTGPGMNTCTYKPEGEWHCSGAY